MMVAAGGEAQSHAIEGTRVLVVEDEFLIADDLRRALTRAGAIVVGPCSDFQRAKQAIEEGGFDCAVLDLNLNDESGVPLADRLRELNVPFALATGYGSEAIPARLKNAPRIEKPFDPGALVELVGRLGAQGARDN